jgi:hypothetical protein
VLRVLNAVFLFVFGLILASFVENSSKKYPYQGKTLLTQFAGFYNLTTVLLCVWRKEPESQKKKQRGSP